MFKKFLVTGLVSLPLLAGAVALANFAAHRHAAEQYYWAGMFKHWEGDNLGALSDLNRALELRPDYDDALSMRGTVRNGLGDYAGAVQDFDVVVAHNPHDLDLRYERADARGSTGDFNGATEDYNSVLAVDAASLGALHGRAYVRRWAGDTKGAMADLAAVLKLDDEFSHAYSSRGRIKLAQGDGAGALEDFHKSVEFGNAYSAYWAYLAAAEIGRRAEGAAELGEFMKTHKEGGAPEWEVVLGDFFLGSVAEPQLFRRAEAAFTDYERRGRLCEAWFYAGMLRQQAGDREGAREYYEKTVATNRGDFIEYWEAKEKLKLFDAAPVGKAK